MLEVSGLVKKFDEVRAVDDVSFSIGKGEVVGLLGPNGAGKTTTMRMLTGYYKPTAGSVSIGNIDIQDDLKGVQRLVGYLPENNCAYMDMLVCDFLHFVASARQLDNKQIKQGIARAVEVTSLQKYYYRPISQLSKGYKQRVGLATTLIHDPDLLILDEPTSGLDPNQIKEIQSLIKELSSKKTIILSTHILSEIEATCERAVIINNGKIVLDKPLAAISQLKEGSQVYCVKLKGKVPKAVKAFSDVYSGAGNEVKDISESSSDTILRLVINDSDSEKIFKTAVKNNYILLELFQEKGSLEDVFSRLTNK